MSPTPAARVVSMLHSNRDIYSTTAPTLVIYRTQSCRGNDYTQCEPPGGASSAVFEALSRCASSNRRFTVVPQRRASSTGPCDPHNARRSPQTRIKNSFKSYRGSVTEDPWRAKLSADEYQVLRQGGTEAPFTGEYTDTETVGTYSCRACGAELFSSTTKFHSGCGWPSFADANSSAVNLVEDRSLGTVRTEVRCAACDSHLGHLFSGEGLAPQDLPDQRYCINSISMTLNSAK